MTKFVKLIVLLFCINLFACKETKISTISFWHPMNYEETKTLKLVIEDFEKNNPNVKILMKTLPYGESQKIFESAVMSATGPDVFRANIRWVSGYADIKIVLPLEEFIEKDDLNDYIDAAMKGLKKGNKIYGIPQVIDCLVLFYNKRILKENKVEPPKTISEFLNVAKKTTNRKINQYGFGFVPEGYFFYPFMWAFGGRLYDPETKKIFINNEGSVNALKFILDLRDKHKVIQKEIDVLNVYSNVLSRFKNGKVAMIMNGPWSTADILSGKEFKDRNNLGATLVPKGPSGMGTHLGGHSYVIAKTCKNKKLAYKFISFINQKKYQLLFAEKNNLLPSRKTVYNVPQIKNNKIILTIKEQFELSEYVADIPASARIYNSFDKNIKAAFLNEKKPRQALNEIARDWKILFEN